MLTCPQIRVVLAHRLRASRAFTLVEMIAATAITMLLVATLLSIINHVTKVWVQARGNTETFAAAEDAFKSMTRKLSQAVLNTYWSYDIPERPTKYVRASELHFVAGKTSELLGLPEDVYPGSAVFFQAPLGRTFTGHTSKLTSRLNETGFFVGFGDTPDLSELPATLRTAVPSSYRYRLFEWTAPTKDLSVYSSASGTDWFKSDAGLGQAGKNLSVVGVNIIGLILMAEYPESDGSWKQSYVYNSRTASNAETLNQLPPQLRVVMVAIDDASASRLAADNGDDPPLAPPEGFTEPEQFEHDLDAWQIALNANVPKINYRVFSTTLSIPNSRWSVH